MTVDELNNLSTEQVFGELFKCCGSTMWAKRLSNKRPFSDMQDLFNKSDEAWATCTKKDGLEAFSHHPKIGNLKNLEEKFASTKEWAGNEQASISKAKKDTLIALAKGNELYEQKFGFIFIVCATGKSAEEMLDLLTTRMVNDLETEFAIAMGEQNKITKIRLKKLVE